MDIGVVWDYEQDSLQHNFTQNGPNIGFFFHIGDAILFSDSCFNPGEEQYVTLFPLRTPLEDLPQDQFLLVFGYK